VVISFIAPGFFMLQPTTPPSSALRKYLGTERNPGACAGTLPWNLRKRIRCGTRNHNIDTLR